MLRFSLGVTCFLQVLIVIQSSGLYSVIGPGTIRSDFKYNVVVALHKSEVPCTFKIGITGPSYNETKTVELQPMSVDDLEFNVPKLKTGDYNLTAVGLAGITFANSTMLTFAASHPSVFVQTDKATYKPGDLVQYRVLFLDSNTRPGKAEGPIGLLINDGAQNRIKQLKNVELTKGVYTGKFQLSEQPVLGTWNIEVSVNDEKVETKEFVVEKYVLPKFDVVIETAKDVAIADGAIEITIRSKYTYGKSVKGKATVSIKPTYHYSDNVSAQKTIDVDGKGHVQFDLVKDLKITAERRYSPPLQILAIMEEDLTGNKQNTTATVNLHTERYRIEGIDSPYTYKPDKPVHFKVVVKNLDGSPVRDSKNLVKLYVEPPRSSFYRGSTGIVDIEASSTPDEKPLVLEKNLDDHGMATFELTLPDSKYSYFSVRCEFLESTAYLSSLSKYTEIIETPELLKVTVDTKKPKLGKDISLHVSSSEVLPYFIYSIVARGNIQKSEYVTVPNDQKSYTIKITPTFEMVPKAKVYVHYILNNDLRFEEITIDFEKDFENHIDISAQPLAKPGDDVKLTIKTDPDSFVGLLGVDQSVLLLKSGNDLSKDAIFNSFNNYETNTPWQRGYGRYPGQGSGVVTLTNAHYPYNDELDIHKDGDIYYLESNVNDEEGVLDVMFDSDTQPEHRDTTDSSHSSSASASVAALKIRKDFAETWFRLDRFSDGSGELTLSNKIPDTITSWVVTGFSLNPKTGIALTENATKIQVFQPFFVSTNLPYSVKRGEVISIPIIIFNYMEKALDAEVTMDNEDREYDFTEATNEVEERPLDEIQRVKRITIPSNTGKSVSFMIRPKKVGQITLKITAVTPLAGDAIHQKLKVEPEGVTQYENRAVFVSLNNQTEQTGDININIPAEVVPDSEYIEFSIVGDLLGPTLKNLDQLVRMPYGCGEQNMVNFVPNILVLKYLDAIGQIKPTINEKAKKFMEIGYQRELTYKHDDGSYSAFGKSDKAGSTWLTAYVVRSFHQAAKYTDIDPKVIVEGLDFLASKQAENGSFKEDGKLFDNVHESEVVLASFVLLAFLENVEHGLKYKAEIDKCLSFIEENVDKADDQYILAVSASALQQGKSVKADKVLARLQSMAKEENERKWWSKEIEKKSENEPSWYWRPRSKDVEITSHILMALLENQSAEEVLPIIKWLIGQRNSNGGFSSTQDTVVGLQALIKFADKANLGAGEMTVKFTSTGKNNDEGSDDGTINVNPENSLVLQTQVLPKSARKIHYSAKGKGSAVVQLSYRYNLAEKDKKPSFEVKTIVKNTPSQQLELEICAEFVPLEDAENKKESNMAVMEVALPSGYTADNDAFANIEGIDGVKRTETKNSDSTIIIYFDSLVKNDIKCIPVHAEKTHAVAKQKPAAVSLYDYYDTERRATDYYEIKSSLCDICEGDDCGKGCEKSK